MTLDQFVAKYDGVRVTAPGGIGGQCVDLVNEYILEVFGFPHEWKNALDWFGTDTAHFDWIRNNPTDLSQIPPRGSIMVWGPGPQTGPNGQHIDIVLSAGAQNFVGFDQNWPIGAYAHHVVHIYPGIVGWGICKVAAPPAVVPPIVVPPVVPPPIVVPPVVVPPIVPPVIIPPVVVVPPVIPPVVLPVVPPVIPPVVPHPIQPPIVPASIPDEIAAAIEQFIMEIIKHFRGA
jgi:CHAP domain